MVRYVRMFCSAVVLVVFCAVLMGTPAGAAEIYFEDDFNGAAIDPLKWNTDIAASRLRFCPTSVPYHHTYGNWQDVSTTPCNGSMQAPPYGYIQVADGAARFSSDNKRTFPYLWAGSPSRPSPFPTDGDFTLEIKMKYDAFKNHGDGIIVFNAENTDPVGSNPAYPSGQNIYGIWADSSGLNGGGKMFSPYSPEAYAYHVYKLAYASGNYSLYVDGSMVAGPKPDSRRPNAIWIGNPVYTSWGISDWTDFTVEYVRVTVPSLSCAQPPSDMVGWWPGDGSAYDLIGSNHGTPAGGASFTEGRVGGAFSLDGSEGYVRVGDRASLASPDGFTVDAWINPRSSEGARVIASKWDDPTGQWSWIFKLHNDGSGKLRIEISRGDLGGTAVLPLNTWSHVAATYDRLTGVMRLYVNGVVDSEGVANFPDTAINSSDADLLIGAVNGQLMPPSEHFDGLIDEVEVFNRALSTEEIRSLYTAGSAGKCKPENLPPTANAGADQTVELTSCAGANVTVDGSGSSDPDNDMLTYIWTENGSVIATGANPAVTLAYGSHTITLTVDDGKGGTASDMVVINVVDTTAPALNVTLSPNVLWPPNHKYVKVTPSITVMDACKENVTVQLLSSSSSEPDNGLGDGDTANDIVVNSDGTISLRAERSGKGSGRVYTVTYQATDAAGNTATGTATVTVPHNK